MAFPKQSSQLSAVFALLICICSTFSYAQKDPVVNSFADEFSKQGLDDPNVSQLLNVVLLTPEEVAFAFQNVSFEYLQKVNYPKAREIADTNLITIGHLINRMTPAQLGVVLGRQVGEIMKKNGVLNQDNASELASKFVSSIAKATQDSRVNTTEDKVKAFIEGYVAFFKAEGVKLATIPEFLTDNFPDQVICVTEGKCGN